MRSVTTRGLISIAGLMVAASMAYAVPPKLLKDVNSAAANLAGSSTPLGFVSNGSTGYFFANDPLSGIELFKTDGTDLGTGLVKDINPGAASSVINVNLGGTPAVIKQYTPMVMTTDGRVWFMAFTPATSWELWVSDGTDSGTHMVKDIGPGTFSCVTGNLFNALGQYLDLPIIAVGNKVYFAANENVNGPGLWVSDGTSAGTFAVGGGTINNGVPTTARTWSFSGPRDLTAFAGKIFFAATSVATGLEPYVYDPSTNTTTQLADIFPGATGGYISGYCHHVIGGKLYFGATNIVAAGGELWQWDGVNPPVQATNINATALGIRVQALPTQFGSKIALIGNNGSLGTELVIHDPSAPLPNATVIDVATGSANSFPRNLTVVGGKLYFHATTTTTGWELYVSDGTQAGTSRLSDFNPGTGPGVGIWSPNAVTTNFPIPMIAKDGKLYYTATPVGSATAADNNQSFTTTVANNVELYVLDPATNTSSIVADLNGAFASTPQLFADFGPGRFLLSAFTGGNGREPWTMATASNTLALVKDLNSTLSSSSPAEFANVPLAGKTYFRATETATGTELYSTISTEASTTRLTDINPGTGNGIPAFLTAVGSNLFYGAFDTTSAAPTGFELYTTDSAGVTTLVTDLYPSATFPSNYHGFANAQPQGDPTTAALGNIVFLGSRYAALNNGKFLFMGQSTGTGRQLAVSDGTAGGTSLITINPGGNALGWLDGAATPVGSVFTAPTPWLNMGDKVYFSAVDGANSLDQNPAVSGGGGELYVSDGTAAGTVLVADINPGLGGSNPQNFVAFNNANFPQGSFLFYADDGFEGNELWVYHAGTQTVSFVKDINPGTASSFVNNPFVVIDGVAYFSANDGAVTPNVELWRTDGTFDGTYMVSDANNDPNLSSNPGPFIALGNKLIYDADIGLGQGFEIQVFDTTQPIGPGNPHQVADLNPGAGDGSTSNYAVLSTNNDFATTSWVYFSGNNGTSGIELFRTDGNIIQLAGDINPGPNSSNPGNFYVTPDGKQLYFSANDGVRGFEPWLVNAAQCNRADITGIGGASDATIAPDGQLTGDDFIAFTNAFGNGDLRADITGIGGATDPTILADGVLTGDDFLAFTNEFGAGCP